jgi:FMN phosphatase YigB (HAD superfamily)
MQSFMPSSPRAFSDELDPSLVSVISVDVFDTILIRKPISEVHRRSLIATLIKKKLLDLQIGDDITVNLLRSTRVQIESLAFRARELFGHNGEVRLTDIIEKQLKILNLPIGIASVFIDAEVEIEKRCLKVNSPLLSWLRSMKNDGKSIIAISDTILPHHALEELLASFAQDLQFTKIYSSADIRETKKDGGLFSFAIDDIGVQAHEIWHMGDDLHADVIKARSAGLQVRHIPRPKISQFLRKSDGAMHLLKRLIQTPRNQTKKITFNGKNRAALQEEFGRTVLGPLVLESSLKLWMYLCEIERDSAATALFCARGGLLMRTAYEMVCERLSLRTTIESRNLMISRLVASRLALERDPLFASKEISREFATSTISQAVFSIAGAPIEIGEEWDRPATADGVLAFLKSPDSEQLYEAIGAQNRLFEQHILDTVGPNTRRLILIDTGLFGSTLRFMIEGNPERSWETVMLARSDYKGTGSEHFRKATGLWTEANNYHFWDPRTSVLRFWQLVEHTFEPQIESASSFELRDGGVRSNLEQDGWREKLETANSPIFKGVMAYLGSIRPNNIVTHLQDVEPSWRRLKQVIVFPSSADESLFSVDNRSIDFGRETFLRDTDRPFSKSYSKKLRHIRLSIWKPGAIVRQFPKLGQILTRALEATYIVKGTLSWRLRRRK